MLIAMAVHSCTSRPATLSLSAQIWHDLENFFSTGDRDADVSEQLLAYARDDEEFFLSDISTSSSVTLTTPTSNSPTSAAQRVELTGCAIRQGQIDDAAAVTRSYSSQRQQLPSPRGVGTSTVAAAATDSADRRVPDATSGWHARTMSSDEAKEVVSTGDGFGAAVTKNGSLGDVVYHSGQLRRDTVRLNERQWNRSELCYDCSVAEYLGLTSVCLSVCLFVCCLTAHRHYLGY